MATGKLANGFASFSRLFLGSNISNPERELEKKIIDKQTIISVENDEAADIVDMSYKFTSAFLSNQFDLRNQAQTINEYRSMSMHAQVDMAIDDIVNEAITSDADDEVISIEFEDNDELSPEIEQKIKDEFKHVMRLLKMDVRSYEIFRQWYVDARLYYHKIIDPNDPKKGILKLINLDPRATKKVKEVLTETDPVTKIDRIVDTRSYFLYDPTYSNAGVGDNVSTRTSVVSNIQQTLELAEDSIAFIHSGLLWGDMNNTVYGHLEKAKAPLNVLRMLEDATAIYRITRAPERRIFYVDTGNLPKKGAEEMMKSLADKYRTKLVFDGSSGKVNGNSHQQSMLEDYWLPRREGGKGTEITTLPAGENLGKIDDVKYFQKKLLESLNVPKSRLESEATISIGNRATEINRDEIKFNKFIQRLRRRFNGLFLDLLRTQLILKNITSAQDWDDIVQPLIKFEYASDLFIKEEQEAQIFENRLAQLAEADAFVGKYFSRETLMKNILRMSDEEIERERNLIKKEIKSGMYISSKEQDELDNGNHEDQMQDFNVPNNEGN